MEIKDYIILFVSLIAFYMVNQWRIKNILETILLKVLGELLKTKTIISVNKFNKEKDYASNKAKDLTKIKIDKKFFSPIVIEIYKVYLENSHLFYLTDYHLVLPNRNLSVRASKYIESIKLDLKDSNTQSLLNFKSDYLDGELRIDKSEKEIDELNSVLTYYDRVLLDKIISDVRQNQNKIITELFY